jgi:hypothetical protein
VLAERVLLVVVVRLDFAWGATKSKITWACPQMKGTRIFPVHLPSVVCARHLRRWLPTLSSLAEFY